jgi:acetyl-CoA acyltransferase
MTSVVIAAYLRSPFTPANRGELARTRPDELATQVVKALLAKTGIEPADVEDVIMGCAFPEGEQGLNIGRMVGLNAGLPQSTAGVTVNRFCGSSMQAIHLAAGAIKMGAGDAFVCAGVESMTRVPMAGFNPMPHPGLYERMPEAYISMGLTAENLAKKYEIPRAEQERFSVESHRKAAAAQGAGKFVDEIVPIVDGNRRIDKDGGVRADASVEAMAKLEPAFDKAGTVTAATSSPLTDGAAAVLVCSEDYAKANGLKPLARIRAVAVAGCAPEIMGIGPVPATEKALKRAGLKLSDVDLIELNEAFAAQALAVIRELGADESKFNPDGGAIAIGHPMGASGARITGKAAMIMQREGKKLALATMCIGGGQGIATVLEAI